MTLRLQTGPERAVPKTVEKFQEFIHRCADISYNLPNLSL